MASYPSATKTFTSRIAGDTIQPAHINDLQDEVNAIETGLRSGLGHVLTVSTFGTNAFSSGGAGANAIRLRNTTAGTGNTAYIGIGNDGGDDIGVLQVLSTTFTTSGVNIADSFKIQSGGTGGMALAVAHAAGTLTFWSGGAPPTLRSTMNASGAWRWHAYGAGTLTTDASGNITAVSDERLKTQIVPFERGSEAIAQVRPIRYHFSPESGLDQESEYSGFSAQNVQAAIPEAVGQTPDGYLTLLDRPILAAAVNAIQELLARVASLEATVHQLQGAR